MTPPPPRGGIVGKIIRSPRSIRNLARRYLPRIRFAFDIRRPYAAIGRIINSAGQHTVSRANHIMVRDVTCRKLQPYVDYRWRAAAVALAKAPLWPHRIREPKAGTVLLAISSLSGGGAERQMLNTAIGLKKRGTEVTLAAEYLHDQPGNAFYLPEALATFGQVDELPPGDITPDKWLSRCDALNAMLPPAIAARIMSAARYIARVQPEIVQSSLDWTNLTFGLGAVIAGAPKIIVSGRNLAPTNFQFFSWFLYPAYRLLLSHPHVTMTNNSRSGADDYAKWLQIAPDKIKIVRNAVDTTRFAPLTVSERQAQRTKLGIAEKTAVIAGAFRMSPEKRPLLWIEAAADLKRRLPSAMFLLCGSGPLTEEVRRRANELGLGESLQLQRTTENIRTTFAAADLVLLASKQEGTPNVLLEAQSLGLPVVTTPAFGAAEAVNDGVTGRVVKQDTPSALAAASFGLLSDEKALATARLMGPRWIEERFGMTRMIDDTLAVMRG